MSQDEFTIISRYFASIAGASEHVVVGPGDDCAVLNVPVGCELCVSTDTLVSGVHFPDGAPAQVIANRTLAANLSDLAAMGAEPHSFVLALTIPRADDDWLRDFSDALKVGSERYGIPLVGGNLSRGPLSVTMTVNGVVPIGEAITRNGAKEGDAIYVTGFIGDAGQGLKLYQSEGHADCYLIDRYINPTPRIEAGLALRGIATAMIDVSDGLAGDLSHLLAASRVAGQIDLGKIPLSPELEKRTADVAHTALISGDDYELCFTAHVNDLARVSQVAREINLAVTMIGSVSAGAGLRVFDNGDPVKLDLSGYQHF